MMPQDSHILSWHLERLSGITLHRRQWKATPDNDHCAFCWDKFAEYSGCLHEGYCTMEGYYWICPACFVDIRERFGWQVKTDA